MPAEGFVLIVEDDPGNRTLTVQQLQFLGREVVAVPGGAEALEVLRADLPSLILLDANMPGMSGQETCRAIRNLPGAEAIPIVAVTADTTEAAREGFFAAGADDVLLRPVLLEGFVAVLARWTPSPPTSGPEPVKQLVPSREGVLGRLRADVDEETTRRIAALYIQNLPKRLDDIEAALTAADAPALSATAHALKSATLLFDEGSVRDRCIELESLGKTGELEGGEAALRELREATDDLCAQLQSEMVIDQPGSAIR